MMGVMNLSRTKRLFPRLFQCQKGPWYKLSEPDNFFNRSKEIQLLNGVTKGTTHITAITGPVNSGKTLLLTKLVESLRKEDVPVLDINLRSISFNSVDSLTCTLQHKLTLWEEDFKQTARKIRVDAGAYGFTFGFEYAMEEKPIASMTPLEKLSNLLDRFSATQLPRRSFWRDRQTPVFVIDEASELWSLKKDPEGEDALHSLFKWLVMNTKEQNKFQALFCSSDSFFHLWVANYVGAHRYQTCVIGDLPKEEAREFWQQLHQNASEIVTFSDAYQFCGGNMFLLQKLCEYLTLSGSTNLYGFPYFVQERMKLIKAYYLSYQHHFLKSAPQWNESKLIAVMQKLVKAESGFLMYDDLCKEHGGSVIDSMIEHNILHLRPTSYCSFDLPSQPKHKAIVTAESACGRIAMENVLKELRK